VDPLSVPPMVMPSTGSTIVFVTIVVALAIAFVIAVQRSGRARGDDASTVKRHTMIALAGIGVWMAGHAAVTASGVLRSAALPPPVMIYLGITLLLAVVFAMSKLGQRFAQHLPIAAIVGVQVFRLPLELVLHQWYGEGVIPVQMTYAGSNFDIVSGILGGVVGVLAWRGKAGVGLVWAYTLLGMMLLVIVMTIAVMSAPVPVRQFWDEPSVQLPLHVPYGWIVSMCVAGALFWHLVALRWLLARDRT
jgi:hypothetical protein